MSNKESAIEFLELIAIARVNEGFEKYVHPEFRHHSPYFKGDRESLRNAMLQNAEENTDRAYTVVHAVEENNLVIVHGKMQVNNTQFRVVHIFKFESEKIVELWDASQISENSSLNENGLF